MAEEKKTESKAPRRRKTPETVRERADKQAAKSNKQPSKLKGKIYRPLSVIRRTAAKEYHPIRLPEDKKVGRVLNKRVRFVPKFVRNSWAEMRLVTWPSPKNALRLTLAVIVFSAVFAILVQVLDFVFNKLFKEILLK